MTIDVVLLSLQIVLLSCYAVSGISKPLFDKKIYRIVILVICSSIVTVGYFFEHYLKSNIQLTIFLLFVLNYVIHWSSYTSKRFVKTIISVCLFWMAFALSYFGLGLSEIWLIVPFIFLILISFVRIPSKFFLNLEEFSLKVGTLLTLFFLLEPIALSVQQNLKPIATIPLSSIINQQNFFLLAGLIILVLGGFLWKEKSNH